MAGVDVDLPRSDAYRFLLGLVEKGVVSEEAIDEAVSRVLRAKRTAGLFENPYGDYEAAAEAYTTSIELAPQINPPYGAPGTTYNFSVRYFDADNNAEISLFLSTDQILNVTTDITIATGISENSPGSVRLSWSALRRSPAVSAAWACFSSAAA